METLRERLKREYIPHESKFYTEEYVKKEKEESLGAIIRLAKKGKWRPTNRDLYDLGNIS